MAILFPHNIDVSLRKQGTLHTSIYTGSPISAITYGTRPLWQVTYYYKSLTQEQVDEIKSTLLSMGNGVATIPFFHHQRDGLPSFFSNKSTIILSRNGNILTLNSIYAFKPGDCIQVGDYCLLITDVAGTDITVANLPETFDAIPDNTFTTSKRGYQFKGRNTTFGFDYSQFSFKNFQPAPLTFIEEV